MLECQSRFFFLREPLNFHFLWELKMLLGCLLVVVAKRDQQDLVIFLIAFNKTIIIPLTLVGLHMR